MGLIIRPYDNSNDNWERNITTFELELVEAEKKRKKEKVILIRNNF